MNGRSAHMLYRLLVFLIVALPMVVLGAGAYVVGGLRAGSNELRRTGVEVTATVVHRYYSVDVEYEVGGTRHRGSVACGPDNCTSFDLGDRVQVRVDPKDPERIALAKNPYTFRGMVIAWTAVGLSLAGIVVAAYAATSTRRRRVGDAVVPRTAATADPRRNPTFLAGFLGLVFLLAGAVTLSAGGHDMVGKSTLALAGLLLAIFGVRLVMAVYRRLRTR